MLLLIITRYFRSLAVDVFSFIHRSNFVTVHNTKKSRSYFNLQFSLFQMFDYFVWVAVLNKTLRTCAFVTTLLFFLLFCVSIYVCMFVWACVCWVCANHFFSFVYRYFLILIFFVLSAYWFLGWWLWPDFINRKNWSEYLLISASFSIMLTIMIFTKNTICTFHCISGGELLSIGKNHFLCLFCFPFYISKILFDFTFFFNSSILFCLFAFLFFFLVLYFEFSLFISFFFYFAVFFTLPLLYLLPCFFFCLIIFTLFFKIISSYFSL